MFMERTVLKKLEELRVHKMIWRDIILPSAGVKCGRLAWRGAWYWRDVTCKKCLRWKEGENQRGR